MNLLPASGIAGMLSKLPHRQREISLLLRLALEPHLNPHRLRHSAATLLIEEGVDITLIQRLLGHTSIASTEIYTNVSDNSLSSTITAADTLVKVDAF